MFFSSHAIMPVTIYINQHLYKQPALRRDLPANGAGAAFAATVLRSLVWRGVPRECTKACVSVVCHCRRLVATILCVPDVVSAQLRSRKSSTQAGRRFCAGRYSCV